MNWLPGQAPNQRQQDTESALLRAGHAPEAAPAITVVQPAPLPAYLEECLWGANVSTLANFTAHANRRVVEYLHTTQGELNHIGVSVGNISYRFSMVVFARETTTVRVPVIYNDDTLYIYLNGVLQHTVPFSQDSVISEFALTLTGGHEHVVQLMTHNAGGAGTGLICAPWFTDAITWRRAATS